MLPRLLYLGDVPIESTVHGSAALYRLLQNYPPDRLRVIESTHRPSAPGRRLPGVTYRHLTLGWRRPLYTRFHRWATLSYSVAASSRARSVPGLLGQFQPQAILTVAHEFLWLTAASFARDARLPLHLICHDDWPALAPIPGPFRPWLGRRFRRAWQHAASRLCVSPFMAREYQRRYTGPGTVLYPARAAGAPRFHSPPDRLRTANGPLTAAFAGTINTPGYVRALQQLASALQSHRGRFLIFGPLHHPEAAALGLDQPHIHLRGLLPSAQLIHQLRAEADLLFVPMSFDPADASNMQFAFPSKLADYTAAGLPLLISGPDYCSAILWTRENSGVAETATADTKADLSAALDRLRDPNHRCDLAARALHIGDQLFSHESVQSVFFNAVDDCRRRREESIVGDDVRSPFRDQDSAITNLKL
jgi:glycosyltransferase involved in cell wall biosynthesis